MLLLQVCFGTSVWTDDFCDLELSCVLLFLSTYTLVAIGSLLAHHTGVPHLEWSSVFHIILL
jgi:hypothetical protein